MLLKDGTCEGFGVLLATSDAELLSDGHAETDARSDVLGVVIGDVEGRLELDRATAMGMEALALTRAVVEALTAEEALNDAVTDADSELSCVRLLAALAVGTRVSETVLQLETLPVRD